MKLKIVNETDYRTADLRKFLAVGLREEGVGPVIRDWCCGYRVKFYRMSERRRGGYGYYNSRNMALGLYDSASVMTPEQVTALPRVFVHELGHNRGLRHKEMAAYATLPVSWAEGLAVRKKIVAPKPKRDVQAKRQRRAEKMLAEHEAKLKREQKLVKKWRQKVRYYERAFEKRAAALKVE